MSAKQIELTCDSDAGELKITISMEEAVRVDQERETERRPGRQSLGKFIPVTDLNTGQRYEIASAPCGLGCHCGLFARRI